MHYIINTYKSTDYPLLKSWWEKTDEVVPQEEMISPTTFILEIDEVPIISVGILLTNCSAAAYLSNFIGNPDCNSDVRQFASEEIIKFITEYAHAKGYKRVLAFAYKEKLKTRFRELGMRPTLSNLEAFVLE